MKATKTGIIYFTRTSNKEARSKKWHPSFSTNLKIANYLIENTKSTLLKTGLDVIVIDEGLQRGACFGEKITSAFEDVFAQGYDSLVLVGNDSVGLTADCVLQSFDRLLLNPSVFGATIDDGLYLVGFQKSFFLKKKERITRLPWRASGLVNAFSRLVESTDADILPLLSDLNSVQDLNKILRFSDGSEVFFETLRALIDSNQPDALIFGSIPLNSFIFSSGIKKRGPPSHVMM